MKVPRRDNVVTLPIVETIKLDAAPFLAALEEFNSLVPTLSDAVMGFFVKLLDGTDISKQLCEFEQVGLTVTIKPSDRFLALLAQIRSGELERALRFAQGGEP